MPGLTYLTRAHMFCVYHVGESQGREELVELADTQYDAQLQVQTYHADTHHSSGRVPQRLACCYAEGIFCGSPPELYLALTCDTARMMSP